MNNVTIIGAGLSGCEAALQLADLQYNVRLYDLKPKELIEPYKLTSYAELVCNNSIGNVNEKSPMGILLKELKLFGSKILEIAEKCRIDDPAFFAVDKKLFSQLVTEELCKKKVKIISKHINSLPCDDNVIIATGPLTDEFLISDLANRFGIETFHFSDASSPVVDIRTVDLDDDSIQKVTNDLYAISISAQDFQLFYEELVQRANQNIVNSIDKSINYEKCQSIEQLAQIGIDELYLQRFRYEYTVQPCLLLRRENGLENGFILVGCMTTLSHFAQLSVFSKIPCLKKCKLLKYGRMHRNTFLDAPKYMNEFFQIRGTNTFVIGQLSGVDGYAPAVASGMVAALRIIYGETLPPIPTNTMIGGLAHYVSNRKVIDFQPMCASFALIDESDQDIAKTILNYQLHIAKNM